LFVYEIDCPVKKFEKARNKSIAASSRYSAQSVSHCNDFLTSIKSVSYLWYLLEKWIFRLMHTKGQLSLYSWFLDSLINEQLIFTLFELE